MAKKTIIPIQEIKPIEMVNLNKYSKLFIEKNVIFEPIQDQHFKYIGFRLKSNISISQKVLNQVSNEFRKKFNKELQFENQSNEFIHSYCGSVLK
jgi:predicted transcriptional regulator